MCWNKFILLSINIIIVGFCGNTHAYKAITPNDVYAQVQELLRTIEEVYPSNLERINSVKIYGAKPLHAYALASALNEKVRLLMVDDSRFIRPVFPYREITPGDVFNLVKVISKNITTGEPQLATTKKVTNKKPKDVLRLLTKCNLKLDALISAKLTPNYPLQQVQYINNILVQMFNGANRDMPDLEQASFKAVTPEHVFSYAENLYRLLVNLGYLKFQIPYPRKPYYSPFDDSKTRPSNVFTLTVINTILLKDLSWRLNYSIKSQLPELQKNPVNPSVVYQQYTKVLLFSHYLFNFK